MHFVLNCTLAKGVNNIVKVPFKSEYSSAKGKTNETKYLLQANWFALRVNVFNHKNELVNYFSYKHNALGLIDCFIRTRDQADKTLQRFCLTFHENVFSDVTLTPITDTPDEHPVRMLATLQGPPRKYRRSTKHSSDRCGIACNIELDKTSDLHFLGDELISTPVPSYPCWSANHVITSQPTLGIKNIDEIVAGGSSEIRKFTTVKNNEDRSNLDKYRQKSSKGLPYIRGVYTANQYELLPAQEKLRVAQDLVDDVDDFDCTMAVRIVNEQLGKPAVLQMIENKKKRCEASSRELDWMIAKMGLPILVAQETFVDPQSADEDEDQPASKRVKLTRLPPPLIAMNVGEN